MSNKLQHLRTSAFHHQDGHCYYCGLRMWHGGTAGPAALRCTAEHLQARCDGGADSAANVVAACMFCNQKRHQRKNPLAPERYKSYVRNRVGRGAWMPKATLLWGGWRQPD